MKTSGSRNHIFANLDLNFNQDESYENNLSVKIQRTSNDTYFRIHYINTALVNSENKNLENEIKYNFNKDDMYLDIETSIYEYLREKDADKREIMKGYAMGGNSGREWANYYDNSPIDFNMKIGSLSYRNANPFYKKIENICNSGTNLAVIQIGSSSGREIAYFAELFSEHRFIGTDVYNEVIEYATQAHKLTNLNFIKLAAKDISQLFSEYAHHNFVVFTHSLCSSHSKPIIEKSVKRLYTS